VIVGIGLMQQGELMSTALKGIVDNLVTRYWDGIPKLRKQSVNG
jgi:hypothetical protein